MLLQLEYAPNGTVDEVEDILKAALALDHRCVEAYIELGHFYYAVLDDAQRGKDAFLRAIDILSELNRDAIQGIMDCDLELAPNQKGEDVKAAYAAKLIRFQTSTPEDSDS